MAVTPFSDIFDEQGRVKLFNPVRSTVQESAPRPAQIALMMAPAPTQAQTQTQPAPTLTRPRIDTAQRMADMDILGRAEIARSVNNRIDGRDDDRRRFLIGQALGLLGGAALGAATGRGAQANLDNIVPALYGTRAMMGRLDSEDAADLNAAQQSLKRYYDAMREINKENAAIDRGNQQADVARYRADQQLAGKKAEIEASRAAQARKDAQPRHIGNFVDSQNTERAIMYHPGTGQIESFPLTGVRPQNDPLVTLAKQSENQQNYYKMQERDKLRNEVSQMYRDLGEMQSIQSVGQEKGPGGISLPPSYLQRHPDKKFYSRDEAIDALKNEIKQYDQRILKYDKDLKESGFEPDTDLGWYDRKYGRPSAGQGHSGRVKPGEMF